VKVQLPTALLKYLTLLLAVSLTSCGASNLVDGAAVLKHSIALSSYPLNNNSKYAYKMFVFVHPEAVKCSQPFEKLGYNVEIRETPIDPSKIRGDFLRDKVIKTGALIMTQMNTCVYVSLNIIYSCLFYIYPHVHACHADRLLPRKRISEALCIHIN
jgi:hypothetical protein